MRLNTLRKVAATAVCCALAGHALAGGVSGTIVFEGTPPVMKPINMGATPECHAMHGDTPIIDETLVLGAGQTMGNILVHVSKGLPAKTWPVPTEPAIITQKGCVYSPHVIGVQAGQALKILNPDNIMHNVNGMAEKNAAFNKGMPKGVEEITIPLDKAEEPFMIKCDVHPWMRSYCAVLDHPFFTVTKEDGKFTLEGLEPGEYEISAWHERLGTQTATVTVAAEGVVTQDFKFSRPAK
jgi:plastocyanin